MSSSPSPSDSDPALPADPNDRPEDPAPPELPELVDRTYEQLRRVAHQIRLEPIARDHATTSLIHEAYIRLSRSEHLSLVDDTHFIRVAARAMRQFLVDRARYSTAAKRGGGRGQIPLMEELVPDTVADGGLLALHEALERLTELDTRKAQVVELRFFGGCGVEETATTLGISVSTVTREWDFARSWLHREITRDSA